MKKIVRLTESDLTRIVLRVIQEQGPQQGVNPGLEPQSKMSQAQKHFENFFQYIWGDDWDLDMKYMKSYFTDNNEYSKFLSMVKTQLNKPTILSAIRSKGQGPQSTAQQWAQKIAMLGAGNNYTDENFQHFMKLQNYLQKFNKAEKWF
jgi:hypothetical protein